jgi:hypothetical protein
VFPASNPFVSSLVGAYKVENEALVEGKALKVCYWLSTILESGSPYTGADPNAELWELVRPPPPPSQTHTPIPPPSLTLRTPSNTTHQDFIDIGLDFESEAFEVFLQAVTSRSIESGGSIQSDVKFVSIGWLLIIVYCCFMVETEATAKNCCSGCCNKSSLALCGIASVGMAIVTSFGLSALLGEAYTPLHTVLPFILIGIGVDDMFVIVSSFSLADKKLPLPERIATSLAHSGASIVVTSMTDFVAFAIGSSTVLPALSSFCVYAALGILFDFIFQITFFTACMSLHHQGRCCVGCGAQPSNAETEKDSQNQKGSLRLNMFLEKTYAPFLMKKEVKGLVVLVSTIMAGAGLAGVLALETDFDPGWFVPDDSYLSDYNVKREEYFSFSGGPYTHLVMSGASGYAIIFFRSLQ